MMRKHTQTSGESLSLHALLGQRLPCSCDVEHVVPTRAVSLGPGRLYDLPVLCGRLLRGQTALVLDDQTTHDIAGQLAGSILERAGYRVTRHTLQPWDGEHLIASDETVQSVHALIHADIDFLVAVGSGTVNDMVKLASFRAGRPYIVCCTAPSMNGFTSAIAAILSKGVKRTVAARPPVAVIADLDILTTAPPVMLRAGLGDMLSKPVSTADWKLAHLIKGEYYCDLPLRIVEQAEQACRRHAEAIGRAAVEGVRSLTEALLLSGISMVVAGSSSPASGGEHLLSHYWDMTAHWYGREEHLHGAQVGVGTLVTATLYEKLQQLRPEAMDLQRLRREYLDWPTMERELRRVHGSLGDEVVGEARKKYVPLAQKEHEWQFIVENWQHIWAALQGILMPARHIREILVAAGAATTIAELGISAEELRMAFIHARDIRGRYTVLDFAHDLGVLEGLADEVLEDSGVLA